MATALAKRIQARAKQLDIPLTRLALDSGVNRSFVYDLLYGRSQKPNRAKLERIATRLKVGSDWLLTGTGRVEGFAPCTEDDAEHVAIRSVRFRAGMAGGKIIEEIEEGEPFHFLARWVRGTLKVEPEDGHGLLANRVEIVPRSEPLRLRIIPDNPRYVPYEIAADEANLVGRIRWFCREL